MGNQIVTDIEAAEYLSLSRKTLSLWRSRGIGPAFLKLGGAVRYAVVDLEQYVEKSRHKADPSKPRRRAA